MMNEEQNIQKDQPLDVTPSSQGDSSSNSMGQSTTETVQTSLVASTPKQKTAMLIGLIILSAGAAYYLIFGQTPTPKEIKTKEEAVLDKKKQEVVLASAPVTPPVVATVQQAPDLATTLPEAISEPTPPAAPVAPLPPVPAAIFSNNIPIQTTPTPSAPTPMPTNNSTPDNSTSRPLFGNSGGPSLSLKSQAELTAEAEAEKVKKRNSAIIIFGSGSSSEQSKDEGDSNKKDLSKQKNNQTSEFLGFGDGNFDKAAIAKTSSPQISATSVGNTDNLIIQGKIMNAILETAINTDLPGSLRAIISRDVYAESGNRVLIPKGSRVIGTYVSTITGGQTRVQVTWNRLVRPDGIDIAVNSIGTDNLGRSGIIGKVDNKLWSQIGSALLVSYIIPNVMNKISGSADKAVSQTTTTVNGVSTTTSTGNSGTISSTSATDQFAEIAQNAINSAYPTKPTITINQGSMISILVQADLIFPTEAALSQQKVVK